MRKLAVLLVALLAAALGPGAAAAPAAKKHRTPYFVALGDSPATGYERAVYRQAREKHRRLKLVRLSVASQGDLKGPVNFLRRHRIRYVTVSIGASRLALCGSATSVDLGCLAARERELRDDLPGIARALRRAAGRRARIAQLLLYNPYLALYLHGSDYEHLALRSDDHVRRINGAIRRAARGQRFRFADGYTAFDAGNVSTTVPYGDVNVPTAVARACRYTQMCLPAPQGNVNPSAVGDRLLARAFEKALGLVRH
jgi:hypothetical protein